jgi:hypothetical protein
MLSLNPHEYYNYTLHDLTTEVWCIARASSHKFRVFVETIRLLLQSYANSIIIIIIINIIINIIIITNWNWVLTRWQ